MENLGKNGDSDQAPTSWPTEAISTLLNVIEEKIVLNLIDGRRQRNSEIFKCIQQAMAEQGFNDYSSDQIRQKWKNMKKLYYKKKQELNRSGVSVVSTIWIHFDHTDRLLGCRPRTQALQSHAGIDSSTHDSDSTCEITVVVDDDGSASLDLGEVEGRENDNADCSMPSSSSSPNEQGPTSSMKRSRKRRRRDKDTTEQLVSAFREESQKDRKMTIQLFGQLMDVFKRDK